MPDFFSRGMQPFKKATALDASIRIVLMVYIAVLPFRALLILERNGFIFLLGLLAGWCILNQRVFYSQTPYDMPLLVFALWVGLTIPFAVAPLYSLQEYGKLLQHMVVFYAVICFFKELRSRKVLLGLIGVIVSIVTVYGLGQVNLRNPQAVVSVFSAEVWFTTFLVIVIPFLLVLALSDGSLKVRIGSTVVVGMMVVCLFGTQSRAGAVALIGEVWVLAWFLRSVSSRIVAMLMTVSVIAIAALVLGESAAGLSPDIANVFPVKKGISSVLHRLAIWDFSLSEVAKHWLVGIGYGNLSYVLLYGQNEEVVTAGHYSIMQAGTHNIGLYLALHVGLPGFVLFGWFIAQVLRKTAGSYHDAQEWISKSILLGTISSVVGLILRLQFDQMFVGSLAVFCWVLLALAVLSSSRYDERAQDSCVGQSGVAMKV